MNIDDKENDLRKKILNGEEIIPLWVDYVFTGIFNDKDNMEIIEDFLAMILNIPLEKIIGKVKIESRDLKFKGRDLKDKEVDLILDLDGKKINIELQSSTNPNVRSRNVVFACDIHSRQLKYGSDYIHINQTIQVVFNINHKNKFDVIDEVLLRYKDGSNFDENLKILIVDVQKGKDKCYNGEVNDLTLWCEALLSRNIEEFRKIINRTTLRGKTKDKLAKEVEKYSKDSTGIGRYMEMTKQEELHLVYDSYNKDEIKKRDAIIKEKDEALKEKDSALKEKDSVIKKKDEILNEKDTIIKSVINNYLNNGKSKEDISAITGLTLEEIEDLLKEGN